MAKQVEKKKLERGKAYFTLVGKAKINDYTFKMGTVSASGYKYNSLNIGVETKPGNVVYSSAMGGYFPDRNENPIHVSDKDDIKQRFIIDWVDRFDKRLLETVNQTNYIRIGIERLETGKEGDKRLFINRFLHWYDAIEYIQEHLTDETVIKIAGVLKYQMYGDRISVKKEIQSIFLSDAEPQDFKATFVQTCIFDKDSVGSYNKETGEFPLQVRVIDYLKEYKYTDDEGSEHITPVKGNFPFYFTMFTKAYADAKMTETLVKQFWKVKEITEIAVEGEFLEGLEMSEPDESDLTEQERMLISIGMYSLEEIMSRKTVKGDRVSKLVVTRPLYALQKNEAGVEEGKLFIVPKKYTEFDLDTSFVFEDVEPAVDEDVKKTPNEATKPDPDSGDLDWLKDLE